MKRRFSSATQASNRMGRTDQGSGLRTSLVVLLCLALAGSGCDSGDVDSDEPGIPPSILNLSHLDHLLELVEKDGTTYGIVHIYAEAPDYDYVHDEDEGAAAVDDAARAAVLYLRHFELTGSETSREKAEALLRFVMRMQTDDGRFYNFVWNTDLEINQTHQNSRADEFGWWAARGVWALGTCARVLETDLPDFAEACARRVRRTYPHIEARLEAYGRTTSRDGRIYPLWLLNETASDATSELMLGLIALREVDPDERLTGYIDRFAEGMAMMQFGDLATYPYGAHASWLETWHGWGNSQTQALAEAGRLSSPQREAEHFYPHLLVDGWMHSMPLDNPQNTREFEQIAYAVRGVAVGLVRLYEATGDDRYAVMAGLAASWFTGNNAAAAVMYDPETGRGFDGIGGPQQVNRNAGAESTIEANQTVMEVERLSVAKIWMHADAQPRMEFVRDGKEYAYRIFKSGESDLAVVLNLTDKRLELLEGEPLTTFIKGK